MIGGAAGKTKNQTRWQIGGSAGNFDAGYRC
jgi:hypothetical protein